MARVRCLPATLKRKARLARYAVIPKAAWDGSSGDRRMQFQACFTVTTIVHRLVSRRVARLPDRPITKTSWQGAL